MNSRRWDQKVKGGFNFLVGIFFALEDTDDITFIFFFFASLYFLIILNSESS